jgi:hypothetical protein
MHACRSTVSSCGRATEVERMAARTRASLMIGASWALWVIALGWLTLYVLDARFGFPCPAYAFDDSAFGEESWQWAPPGVACTYTDLDGEVLVRIGPGWGPFVVVLMLVALPVLDLARRRLGRGAGATDPA